MRQAAAVTFPSYLREHPGGSKWLLHDEYEKLLVDGCYAELAPRWGQRLIGPGSALRSHCWTMIVALLIFAAGGGVSLIEGIRHMVDPHEVEYAGWNYALLAVAVAPELRSVVEV